VTMPPTAGQASWPVVGSPLEEVRDRLRQAVTTGSYQEAQRRLMEYAGAVSAAPDAATVRSALDLLRWADRAVRAGRAHAAAEAERLAASRPYRAKPPSAPPRIELDA